MRAVCSSEAFAIITRQHGVHFLKTGVLMTDLLTFNVMKIICKRVMGGATGRNPTATMKLFRVPMSMSVERTERLG
jgi:hypothetical protein